MIAVKPSDNTFESAVLDITKSDQLKEYEGVLNAEKAKMAGPAE
jgi:hypothetical protein